MFKSYFKTAFRQLRRNKLFSIVNIVGLSTGFASIMALALLVYQYITTDSNQVDIGQMYYLKTKSADGNEYTQTPYPLLGEIVKKCPEVQAATHAQQWYYPWLKFNNKEIQETTVFGDTGYFKVFQFPFKYGNAANALQDKYSIVFSEEVAKKLFGNVNPVGKIVTADDTLQLTVTGVLQHVPSNSSIQPSVLLPSAILESNSDFKNGANWYNTFASNYLRLRANSSPQKLENEIAQIVKTDYAPEQKKSVVTVVPFSKITEENSSLTGVIIKGAVGAGIFILLIILVNLINLNTAGMYTRAKEVAVKQMIGGRKKNIVWQFCIENGLIVFSSILLAWLIFSALLLPSVNDITKDKFGAIETGIGKDYPILLLFTGMGLLFTVIAASVPAIKLATVKVTDAVKGKIMSGNFKSSSVRSVFIVVQFTLAITLIAVTLILNRQIGFMKSSPLGFNKDNVAVVSLDLAFRDPKAADARFVSIVDELKNNPHVKAVSVNGEIPTSYWDNYNTYYDPATNKDVHMRQAPADAGYLATYQIPLIQGKTFSDQLTSSQKNGVLINRTAMKALGWDNAVGKEIRSRGENTAYTVVGVTEDFNYRDLQGNIEPLIHWYAGKPSINNSYLSISIQPGYIKPVMEHLKQEFKSIPSRRDFSYEMMSDKVDKQYALLDGILKISNYVALLTVLIASMGMFGLIALFARQRVKEIGIRKVLGASVAGIVQLLSKEFLILVGVSILIAAPAAWYLMNKWLLDFAYRIDIKWWMLLAAGGIAILIALATISYQAVRAALANPVKSLRTE
ncbi:MAG TPA: ABC transporter permease [Chitinophagaceae bacterium]|nr:ABC transporter permease [Chitinophagaceae bacterium]